MLLAAARGLGILWTVEHADDRVSLDVLELLPRDEQDPTIRLARQTVSGRFGRTVLIALSDRDHPAASAGGRRGEDGRRAADTIPPSAERSPA